MKYMIDNFNEDIAKITSDIKASGKQYDYIVGLIRGGTIPAVVLSHKLGISKVVMLNWSHEKDQREYSTWIPEEIQQGKRVLIVDDIVDSGRSMRELIEGWGATRELVDIAALVYNVAQDVDVTYYGRIIDRRNDVRWVDFWWEGK